MTTEPVSIWKGSPRTAGSVQQEISKRFGPEAAEKYHPELNCFTFNGWQQRGYRVKKGEKAIRSYTFINGEKTVKDSNGNEKREGNSYVKGVCLFYIDQVEPIKNREQVAA